MRRKIPNKICILCVVLLFCTGIQAQSGFAYSSSLDPVPQSGFFQINLQPFLAARLQSNSSDIRILDTAEKQVPYLLKSDLASFSESRFTSLPIVSNKKEADKQTHIVIENPSLQPLSELLLLIKNTDASRYVNLSGSDDNQHWFVIKEGILLNNLFTNSTQEYLQSISFPTGNYRYFGITILGKDLLPVNIIKAGIYEQHFFNGRFLSIPEPRMVQKDSNDKCSYILLKFDDSYFIDRLEFSFSGSKFYKRKIELNIGTIGAPKLVLNDEIGSDRPAVFTVSVKTNHLLLKIYNEDNPPLRLMRADAFQLNRYLLCYLEKDKVYHLELGDSAAAFPAYDLGYFKDSIHANPSMINHGRLEKNKHLMVKERPAPVHNPNLWIWISILAASMVLLLLTFKLTKEINNKKE